MVKWTKYCYKRWLWTFGAGTELDVVVKFKFKTLRANIRDRKTKKVNIVAEMLQM